MSKKTVIVCGATGKQGKAVIDALKKDSSFDIRALVRNPDSPAAKALVEAGVTLVKGDFGDKNSLVRAFQGNWGVYIVTVPEPFNHAGCQKEIKVGKDAVDAAKEANVNFVVMSSVGRADKHTGIPHFESKGQIEDHLRASGLKHCILRPVAFMDNLSMPGMELKQGVYTGLTNPGVKLDYIAVDDIGEFAALAFKDPHKFEGKAIELAGDSLTGEEVAAVISKVRNGEPFTYSQAPLWLLRWIMPEITTMADWFNATGYNTDIAAVRAIYPGTMTFEQWLRKKGYDKKQLQSSSICVIS